MPQKTKATIKTIDNEVTVTEAAATSTGAEMVEGMTFEDAFTEAHSLRDLHVDIDKVYTLECKQNSIPTKFGSYIVECSDYKTGEEISLFMPKYVYDQGNEGQCFIYKGLRPTGGLGHEYHRVMWNKK